MEGIHWSTDKITTWKNTVIGKEQASIQVFGKPAGFWYAYNDYWRNYMESQGTKVSYKYVFPLTNDMFTTELDADDSTKQQIFKLTSDNIEEFFNYYFNYDEFVYSPKELLGIQLQLYLYSLLGGGSALSGIDLLFSHYDELLPSAHHFLEQLPSENGNNEEIEINTEDLIDTVDKETLQYLVDTMDAYFHALPKKKRYAYKFSRIDWGKFWRGRDTVKGIQDYYAGIDFDPSILDKTTIEVYGGPISVRWLEDVEFHSGVLFKPNQFFTAHPPFPRLVDTVHGGKKRRTYKKHKRTKKVQKTRKIRRYNR